MHEHVNESELKKELWHFNEERLRHKEKYKEKIRAVNREEFMRQIETEPETKVVSAL